MPKYEAKIKVHLVQSINNIRSTTINNNIGEEQTHIYPIQEQITARQSSLWPQWTKLTRSTLKRQEITNDVQTGQKIYTNYLCI